MRSGEQGEASEAGNTNCERLKRTFQFYRDNALGTTRA